MERSKLPMKTALSKSSDYSIAFTTHSKQRLTIKKADAREQTFIVPSSFLAGRIKYPSKGYQGL